MSQIEHYAWENTNGNGLWGSCIVNCSMLGTNIIHKSILLGCYTSLCSVTESLSMNEWATQLISAFPCVKFQSKLYHGASNCLVWFKVSRAFRGNDIVTFMEVFQAGINVIPYSIQKQNNSMSNQNKLTTKTEPSRDYSGSSTTVFWLWFLFFFFSFG